MLNSRSDKYFEEAGTSPEKFDALLRRLKRMRKNWWVTTIVGVGVIGLLLVIVEWSFFDDLKLMASGKKALEVPHVAKWVLGWTLRLPEWLLAGAFTLFGLVWFTSYWSLDRQIQLLLLIRARTEGNRAVRSHSG